MTDRTKSILAIDSDPSWLEFCVNALQSDGYKVFSASNICKGQELLGEQIRQEIDLILVDMRSVGENEKGFAELINSLGKNGRLIVVLFAVDMPVQKMRAAFQAGAVDCLRKPYDPISLQSMVVQIYAEHGIRERKPKKESSDNSVLIVDDDDHWLSYLISNLPPIEHVEVAADYQTAMEKLNEQSYGLIISDLRLNDSDDRDFSGLNLIDLIRKQDKRRDTFTPVIVISAYGTPLHIRQVYREFDVENYFDKKCLSVKNYKDSIQKCLRLVKSHAGLGKTD